MILEFEGYRNQSIIFGKKCTLKRLKQMYFQALRLNIYENDLIKVFCRLYDFEEVPYCEDIEVDYIIDTDTDLITKPRY